jgi:hypothetical protein
LNDEKVRRRRFIPSSQAFTKFAGEHNSSPSYSNSFYAKNINEIRHIMKEHINNTSHWGAELRHYDNSKIQNPSK